MKYMVVPGRPFRPGPGVRDSRRINRNEYEFGGYCIPSGDPFNSGLSSYNLICDIAGRDQALKDPDTILLARITIRTFNESFEGRYLIATNLEKWWPVYGSAAIWGPQSVFTYHPTIGDLDKIKAMLKNVGI